MQVDQYLRPLFLIFNCQTPKYEASVNPNVSAITIHPDLFSRLGILKNAI